VVVLVTAGTRDVTSLQAAAGKERAMHRNLERMKERKVMGALSGGA
jgi:ERCC4-related helicase